MMKAEELNKIENIKNHIHVSMRVEGTTEYFAPISQYAKGKQLIGLLFKITDKKRGIFYISWLTEDIKPFHLQHTSSH